MTEYRKSNLDGILKLIVGDNGIGDDEESGLCSFVTTLIDGVETVFRINHKLASADVLSVEAVWVMRDEKLVLLWPNSSAADDCSNNLVQAFSLFDQLVLVFFGSLNKITRVALFSDLVKGHYPLRRGGEAVKTVSLKISMIKAMGIKNVDTLKWCTFSKAELNAVPQWRIRVWQYESLKLSFSRCIIVPDPEIEQFELRNEIISRNPEKIVCGNRFFTGRRVSEDELCELKVLPGDCLKLIVEGGDNLCECVSVFHDPQNGGINILPESVFKRVYA